MKDFWYTKSSVKLVQLYFFNGLRRYNYFPVLFVSSFKFIKKFKFFNSYNNKNESLSLNNAHICIALRLKIWRIYTSLHAKFSSRTTKVAYLWRRYTLPKLHTTTVHANERRPHKRPARTQGCQMYISSKIPQLPGFNNVVACLYVTAIPFVQTEIC